MPAVRKNVAVVGAGIIGLTTAFRLQHQYDVHVFYCASDENIVSQVAGAIWYPYSVGPRERVLVWAAETYKQLIRLANEGGWGVTVVPFEEHFLTKPAAPWWGSAVNGLTPAQRFGSVRWSRQFLAPVIDATIHLQRLTHEFVRNGGRIRRLERPVTRLADQLEHAPVVVNCTGLGSYSLATDTELYPIKGQVVKTTNPGLMRGLAIDEGPLAVAYIIPHPTHLVLGGTAERGNWSTDVNPEDTADILRRCTELEPMLSDVTVLSAYAGLRPGRDEVRLEVEAASSDGIIVHNYGHGGAGYTLAWGCANEVAKLATEWFEGRSWNT